MSLYSFVTTIDILHGNEKLIDKFDEKSLEEIWHIIKKEIEELKEEIEFEDIHIGTFNKLLIISNVAKDIESLKEIIYFLRRIQTNLLLKGILIRGALTIGECYYVENFFSGSATEEAYSLAIGKATIPRIILSEKIKVCLNEYNIFDIKELQYEIEDFSLKKDKYTMEYLNEEIQVYNIEDDVKNSLKLDKDGMLYIDYIKECIEEYLGYEKDCEKYKKSEFNYDFYEYYFHSVINKIKKLILDGINANDDMEVILKYIWLKEYYNKTLICIGGSSKNRAYIIN